MHALQAKILDPRIGNEFPLPQYATATIATNTASIILPAVRAGWKYTVIVATTCLPSGLPRKSDSGDQKVKRLAYTDRRAHV